MSLVAKFDGICHRCKLPIKAGDKIFWTRNNPSRHTKCPNWPRKWEQSKKP